MPSVYFKCLGLLLRVLCRDASIGLTEIHPRSVPSERPLETLPIFILTIHGARLSLLLLLCLLPQTRCGGRGGGVYVDGGFLHLRGVSFEGNRAEAHQVPPVAARMSFYSSQLFWTASTAHEGQPGGPETLIESSPLYCCCIY